jgi:hypothetical protein
VESGSGDGLETPPATEEAIITHRRRRGRSHGRNYTVPTSVVGQRRNAPSGEVRDDPWPRLLDFWGLPNLQIINREVHASAIEARDRRAARSLLSELA